MRTTQRWHGPSSDPPWLVRWATQDFRLLTALIKYPLCHSKTRTPFGPLWAFCDWLHHTYMVSVDYWLAEYPELRRTTQPLTIGGPSGEPGFCISCSTVSVTPFSFNSPCSHHCIIMKFSGVITNDRSDIHGKGQGQSLKVKVTEVKTQLNGLTVSGLLLQFQFTNCYEMMHKAWSSVEEVRYCFSRSSFEFQGHAAQKSSVDFDANLALNSPVVTKWCTKLFKT